MDESLLSQTGLSLDRLRNFCAVADAGSITKAAGGDPARMSLFSRQLTELETFFGTELRRRHGKGLVLTEAGHRLAALARSQFGALKDFKNACRDQPLSLSIGASNSLTEWLLLPKLAAIRKALPQVHLHLQSARTGDLVSGLTENRLDLAIVRTDALTSGLRSAKLGVLGYFLYVPKSLSAGLTSKNLKLRLADLPLATSSSGQFRQRLESTAAKANWPLRITLSCSSFIQAARAVQTGLYAAVLPSIAVEHMKSSAVTTHDLPFLKSYIRPLSIAWSAHTAGVREIISTSSAAIQRILMSSES